MYRITDPSPVEWDQFISRHTRAHFLQQFAWGELKHAHGWQVTRIGLKPVDGDTLVAGAQVLFRRLAADLVTMAYVPMGPYVTRDDQWTALWGAIDKRARQRNAAFLKWEPGIYLHETPPDFTRWQFRPSPQTIQPPNTILIDIRDSDEALLARMNQGTRRKVRQSLKNDIRYYEASADDLSIFTDMMQTTGTRNEFGVHSAEYYTLAYHLFVPDDAVLILAEHEGDPLAGIMVFAAGRMAWYVYGASSNTKRNLMATYGVQWQAIQWARARGCHYYDLWGIPDADEATLEAQFQDRSDGLWGVYGFKRGWGGQVVRSAGAWDRVYNPLIYNGYRAVLWLREQNQG